MKKDDPFNRHLELDEDIFHQTKTPHSGCQPVSKKEKNKCRDEITETTKFNKHETYYEFYKKVVKVVKEKCDPKLQAELNTMDDFMTYMLKKSFWCKKSDLDQFDVNSSDTFNEFYKRKKEENESRTIRCSKCNLEIFCLVNQEKAREFWLIKACKHLICTNCLELECNDIVSINESYNLKTKGDKSIVSNFSCPIALCTQNSKTLRLFDDVTKVVL